MTFIWWNLWRNEHKVVEKDKRSEAFWHRLYHLLLNCLGRNIWFLGCVYRFTKILLIILCFKNQSDEKRTCRPIYLSSYIGKCSWYVLSLFRKSHISDRIWFFCPQFHSVELNRPPENKFISVPLLLLKNQFLNQLLQNSSKLIKILFARKEYKNQHSIAINE